MLNINNLLDEHWKPVTNYEGYYWVSNKGRVKNSRKIMKFYQINSGYLCIDFTVNKVKKKFLVHRLVAQAFLPTKDTTLEVNHINEDKTNNVVENLQWCTSSSNKQHSIATGTYDKIFTQKNTLGKKHKATCKSKYHNVTWDKNRERWQASVRHEGKTYFQKRFKTEEEAALHVNWILDTLNLTDRPKNVIN